jgi:hypothetical protein
MNVLIHARPFGCRYLDTGELSREATVSKMEKEGGRSVRRNIDYYNL